MAIASAGLAERNQPALYVATKTGLRWCGLERLGVVRLGPGRFIQAAEASC